MQCQRYTLIILEEMQTVPHSIRPMFCPFVVSGKLITSQFKMQAASVLPSCLDENDPAHKSFENFKLVI